MEGIKAWMQRRKRVNITVVFFLAHTEPSCICQQEVKRVHRHIEGASSSLTSLSLSPVTLTLGVSAHFQILPPSLCVTPSKAALSLGQSLSLCIYECFV